MKNCTRCDGELIDDLDVKAQGVYQVAISYKKKVSSTRRGSVQASLCPDCGDVSFYLEKDAIEVILTDLKKK
jgi:hypothetical protein